MLPIDGETLQNSDVFPSVSELSTWRAEVFVRASRLLLAVGTVPLLILLINGAPGLGVAEVLLVLGLCVCGAVWGSHVVWGRRIAVSLLVAQSVGGLTGLIYFGPAPGASVLVLMASVIGAGVFIGSRAVWWGLALNALGLAGIGLAMSHGYLPLSRPPAVNLLSTWMRITSAFLAFTIIATSCVTALIARLERGLHGRQAALEQALKQEAERREEESRRQVAERALVNSQKLELVGRVAAGIAHDLNNALVVIVAWAETMEADASTPVQREHAAEAKNAAWRAAQVARHLLTMARQDTNTPVATDLAELLTRLLPTCQRMLPADVRIALELQPLPAAQVDDSRLDRVLLNLALNARDAMPSGGTLTFSLRRATPLDTAGLEPGDYLAIDVRDTGVGIDAETQRRIFEPFFTTKRDGLGTGLGLDSVRAIMQDAGGRVHLVSDMGRGSTFTVVLPVAEQEPSSPQSDAPTPIHPMTVLVVDDDDNVRRILTRSFRRWGHTVLEASTATSALERARLHVGALDLLFVDGILPDGSGRKVIEGVRAIHPSIRVLICSGHLEEHILRDRVGAGDFAFLHKPFSRAELLQKVEETMLAAAVR